LGNWQKRLKVSWIGLAEEEAKKWGPTWCSRKKAELGIEPSEKSNQLSPQVGFRPYLSLVWLSTKKVVDVSLCTTSR
jgi:hypothetical protein